MKGARTRTSWLERASTAVTHWTGSTMAQAAAFALVIGWLVTGPLFGYSNTWQLVINTATTVVTFLMVFMIQRAQNKESSATALKLNEIIAALEGASNRMIDVEELSEEELRTLARHFRHLVDLAKQDTVLTRSHSIEEAATRHARKMPRRRGARDAS